MRKFRTIRHFDVPGDAHELTFSCVDMLSLFSDDEVCRWFVDAMERARVRLGFHLWAYVIMPNHVHLLIFPPGANCSVSEVLKSVKQPVSRRYLNSLRKRTGELTVHERIALNKGRFWQEGPGFDRNVHVTATVHNMIRYIHNNPVRRGLVSLAEDWVWSSARAWAGTEDSSLSIDRELIPPMTR